MKDPDLNCNIVSLLCDCTYVTITDRDSSSSRP